MIRQCRNCKHWGVTGTYTLPGGSVHKYSAPIFIKPGYQQCLRLEEELDQDGEPCAGNAHLGTAPLFSCSLWEAL